MLDAGRLGLAVVYLGGQRRSPAWPGCRRRSAPGGGRAPHEPGRLGRGRGPRRLSGRSPRFGVDAARRRPPASAFPVGTLAVNVSGAFLLGLLAGAVGRRRRAICSLGAGGARLLHDLLDLDAGDAARSTRRGETARSRSATSCLSIALGLAPPPSAALGRSSSVSTLFGYADEATLGRFVADHAAVVGFAHPAFVDQQVGVADHLGEGEEGLGDGDVAPDRLRQLVAGARPLGDQAVDLLLAPLVARRGARRSGRRGR